MCLDGLARHKQTL